MGPRPCSLFSNAGHEADRGAVSSSSMTHLYCLDLQVLPVCNWSLDLGKATSLISLYFIELEPFHFIERNRTHHYSRCLRHVYMPPFGGSGACLRTHPPSHH